jgi:hypothetical protein
MAIIDGLLLFSQNQDLTVLAANTLTASTNVLDFSQPREIGVSHLMLFATLTAQPAGTAGTSLTIALQESVDNATWVTTDTFQPMTIAQLVTEPFAVRAQLPITGSLYRYMRLAYTVSAVLTAGQIEAGLVLNVSRIPYYPRNFVA